MSDRLLPPNRNAAWFEQMYHNRARVPDHPQVFAGWALNSVEVRSSLPCDLDVAYGDSPGQTLDVFPARGRDCPVLVFIHGGYWRAMDKSDFSCIAPSFTAQGVSVVVVNYDLCPDITVPGIALQMTRALAWVWRHAARYGGDPSRITVAGHSAGGHLAAMLMACRWPQVEVDLPSQLVRRAVALSGLFELECMRRMPSMQEVLRLDEQQVLQASPAWMPAPPAGELLCLVGALESEEFLRHNGLMRKAWGAARVPVSEALPRLNHFTIVDALTQPGHRLHELTMGLLRR